MHILVVQTAFLGDLVMTTPLLRELARARPDARITVVASARWGRVLAGLPHVDAILPFDKRWEPRGLASFARLALRLPRLRADVAIAAQRSTRTGQLLWLSRAPLRIGFAGAAGAWAYHRTVAWSPQRHAVERYLDLARPLGGDPDPVQRWPELVVDREAERAVAARLAGQGIDPRRPFLCVAPGSMRATKRWTPAGFASVVARAASEGWPVVLAGTARERRLCAAIAAGSGVRPAVLAGGTSVAELVALIALAAAVVANDSGAGHVAAAVGTPVLSIFGPSDPQMGYGPLGRRTGSVAHAQLACRPCDAHGPRRCPLGHRRCMSELSADRVFSALQERLADWSCGPDTPRAPLPGSAWPETAARGR